MARTPNTASVMRQAKQNLRNTAPGGPKPRKPKAAKKPRAPKAKMPGQLQQVRKQVAKTNLPQTIL